MAQRPLSRRTFLALASAAAGSTLYAAPTPATPPTRGILSLAGSWRFALDRDDVGAGAGWHMQDLPSSDHIALPGILQMQGYGDDITAETKFVAALPRDMAWYKLPQYAEYTKPGNVKVPYLSQPVKHYLGVAWYQREIAIPVAWTGKRVGLTLERTRWQTTVYLDGKEVGTCHTLVAPHDYDFGVLTPGKHRLSIRIDNRMILPYRPDGHGVSDAEGATWNGIVGRMELAATSPVWIEDAQVFPNVTAKSATVKVRIGNVLGGNGWGLLSAGAIKRPVSWDEHGGESSLEVPLPNAVPWSEFTPVLQRLTLQLSGNGANDQREVSFGLREIRTDGKQIRLNGELFHMRGTHDGGGFPLTGYPATDVPSWKRIIGICKEWGMNAIRFHSWCPPEAAFVAADELGFYLQPECGMWNSFDAEGKMLAVLQDETARLLKAFGNHPSFVMLNATNEPAGHYNEQLPGWDTAWREADPRRLYADGTGRPAFPAAGKPYAADFLVVNRVPPGQNAGRGPNGWFGGDYEAGLHDVPIPCIGHEIGQWCAYPNFDVIAKFTGYMKPGNYEIWRDSAAAHHLVARNRELAHASGRFQVACYKEEVEASLRTPSYSGYEMLDLHDYLGQGGALIGVLDAFWETKGYVTAEEYRRFNNETVLLARLKQRTYTTADTLKAEVEIAHFGPHPLKPAGMGWKILDGSGKAVARGSWFARAIPRGKNIALGSVSADLSRLPAPAQYVLVTELHGAKLFSNQWNFWVYPEHVDFTGATEVMATGSWREAESRLAAGGNVLFTPSASMLPAENPKMSTVPTFWNRLMNPGGAWMLGLLCDTAHPALKGFPTEAHCDWQWSEVAGNAHALNMDTLPSGLEPVVQAIDDWNRNWKLGLLYECKVGPGRLMVCGIDLESPRAGAASLRQSILRYMQSAAFQPTVAVGAAELHRLFPSRAVVNPGPVQPHSTSPDLDDPGQIHKKPQ